MNGSLAEQAAFAGELVIPPEVRNSPAFRAKLRVRVALCFASIGWLIYSIVSGGYWLDLAGSCIAVLWAILITVFAFAGRVLRKRE